MDKTKLYVITEDEPEQGAMPMSQYVFWSKTKGSWLRVREAGVGLSVAYLGDAEAERLTAEKQL